VLGIIVEGVVVGSLYALIALGPCLVYGLMRVLDIANAAALTLAAYLTLLVYQSVGSVLLGLLLGAACAGALGWLVQRHLYMPILDKGPIITLITSIGLYIAAAEVFRLVFGPLQRNVGVDVPVPTIRVGGAVVTGVDLIILVVGIGLLVMTWVVLARTRYGIVWRAVAQDRDIAATMGVNSKRVIGSVFVLGYALSAVAGVLLSLKYDAVSPTMGDVPAYKMLAIIILGGLGSPLGTIVAAMAVGLIETVVVARYGFVIPRDAIAFAALVLILLVRPQGLIPSRVVRT
jgi:branched-chain amino acid transport system permease protein